LLISCKFCFNR